MNGGESHSRGRGREASRGSSEDVEQCKARKDRRHRHTCGHGTNCVKGLKLTVFSVVAR